jgi:hypothetical protein
METQDGWQMFNGFVSNTTWQLDVWHGTGYALYRSVQNMILQHYECPTALVISLHFYLIQHLAVDLYAGEATALFKIHVRPPKERTKNGEIATGCSCHHHCCLRCGGKMYCREYGANPRRLSHVSCNTGPSLRCKITKKGEIN